MANYVGTSNSEEVTGNQYEANIFKNFGVGSDTLFGGVLDDRFGLAVDQSVDKIDGGKGRDLVDYSEADRSVLIDLSGANETGTVMARFGVPLVTVARLAGIEDATGSKFNDAIYGSNARNTLDGNAGDDTIYGMAKEDTLFGREGKDTLDGGDDADTLIGGADADTLRGGSGLDTASYIDSPVGVFVDLFAGTASGGTATGDSFLSIENLVGSAYFDTLKGDNGPNEIHGGDGGDMLYDENGDDHVYGDKGDDTMIAGRGSDSFDGGEGIDTVSFVNSINGLYLSLGTTHAYGASTPAGAHERNAQGAGIAGTYDTVQSVENAIGSNYGDDIYGSDGDNFLYGLGGDDHMDGGQGRDTMLPGTGSDYVRGGEGVDTISFTDRTVGVEVNLDVIGNQRAWDLGPNGQIVDGTVDTLYLFENIAGSPYDDSLWGDDNGNTIRGMSGGDYMQGKRGADTLIGDGGQDFLAGGPGRDLLTGGSEADTFYFASPADGSDPVTGLADVITDYQPGVDTLMFSSQGFGYGILTTPLELTVGNGIVEGTNPVASSTQRTFLYNTSSHILSFDADGTGAGAAVPLALLSNVGHIDHLFVA